MFEKILKLFSKNKVEMSFQQSMDLAELPVVTFYQNGNKYNLLLDSGSSDNIIDKSVIKKLHCEMYEGEGDLTGLDGIVHKVPACNITFSYKDLEYPYLYLIKDMTEIFSFIKKETGVTLHGIIGTKFFAKYKYILDFNKLIAYSAI